MLRIQSQWLSKILRRSLKKQRQNSLSDIRSRDSVDMAEYDVLEHDETTGCNLEETGTYNSCPNSSHCSSMCAHSKSKSLPICIPRKTEQKQEGYEAFRTSSMCSTFQAEDEFPHRTPMKLMKDPSDDDGSVSTASSSSSEVSLVFTMSPVK